MSGRSAPAAAAAVAVLMLVLLVTPAAAQPGTYTVNTCTALSEELAKIAPYMATVTKKGKSRFTINLGCGSDADYTDCPATAMSVDWSPAPAKNLPSLEVVIRGADGCAGDTRPALSAAATGDASGEPLFSVMSQQQAWWLTNLKIDGGGERGGIIADTAGPLTLTDVDVANCVASPSSGNGAGVKASATAVAITRGEFANNAASGPGGAVYIHIDGAKDGLAVKGSKFTSNVAEKGAAIYIWKTSPKLARFTCAQCTFTDNDATYGSAVLVERDDSVEVNGVTRAGTPPTVKINLSTFQGNTNPATAFCGVVNSETLKRSRVQLARNVNLAKKPVFSEADCSDFAIADQSPESSAAGAAARTRRAGAGR